MGNEFNKPYRNGFSTHISGESPRDVATAKLAKKVWDILGLTGEILDAEIIVEGYFRAMYEFVPPDIRMWQLHFAGVTPEEIEEIMGGQGVEDELKVMKEKIKKQIVAASCKRLKSNLRRF